MTKRRARALATAGGTPCSGFHAAPELPVGAQQSKVQLEAGHGAVGPTAQTIRA